MPFCVEFACPSTCFCRSASSSVSVSFICLGMSPNRFTLSPVRIPANKPPPRRLAVISASAYSAKAGTTSRNRMSLKYVPSICNVRSASASFAAFSTSSNVRVATMSCAVAISCNAEMNCTPPLPIKSFASAALFAPSAYVSNLSATC